MSTVPVDTRRFKFLTVSMLSTFVVLRVYLHTFPNQDFDVMGYNVHHLFTGLLLVTAGGIPLVILPGASRFGDLATIVFGVGLTMALDEWMYLITTDGSNASYLLPVSFWGGVGFVGGAIAYAALLRRFVADRSASPQAPSRNILPE